MKKVRHIDEEAALGEKAAREHVLDKAILDLPAMKRTMFAHGYTQALLDVADGKVTPPTPDWRQS